MHRSLLRPALPLLLPLAALWPVPSPEPAAAGRGPAAPPRPVGLFVCRGPSQTPDKEVDFPFIKGWLVRPGWNRVEPAEGKYDWTYIEHSGGHSWNRARCAHAFGLILFR